jgi:hypothetical protein
VGSTFAGSLFHLEWRSMPIRGQPMCEPEKALRSRSQPEAAASKTPKRKIISAGSKGGRRNGKKPPAVPYATEDSFVKTFIRAMKMAESPFAFTGYAREFSNGTTSRPDVVAVGKSGEVFAIEAKLSRWRDAMQQAYRNTFFADRSFVLLPPSVAKIAAANASDFSARGVGICTVIDGAIRIVVDAPLLDPHNIYRRELAREYATKKRVNR